MKFLQNFFRGRKSASKKGITLKGEIAEELLRKDMFLYGNDTLTALWFPNWRDSYKDLM